MKLLVILLKNNDVMKVNAAKGNAIILSENYYNNLVTTIEISSNLAFKNKVIKGKNTNIKECIDINKITW